jgi:hypothetical protein
MESSRYLSQHWSWSLHSVLLLLLLVLVTESGEYSPVLIAGGLANYGAPIWTYYSLLYIQTINELLIFLDALLNRGIAILRQHANRLFWWLYYPSRVRPLRGLTLVLRIKTPLQLVPSLDSLDVFAGLPCGSLDIDYRCLWVLLLSVWLSVKILSSLYLHSCLYCLKLLLIHSLVLWLMSNHLLRSALLRNGLFQTT